MAPARAMANALSLLTARIKSNPVAPSLTPSPPPPLSSATRGATAPACAMATLLSSL